FGRPPSRENYKNAIDLYEQALRVDPQFTEAKTFLAGALVNRVISGFADSRMAELARAEKLIDESLQRGPRSLGSTTSKARSCAPKGDATMRCPSSRRRWLSIAT